MHFQIIKEGRLTDRSNTYEDMGYRFTFTRRVINRRARNRVRTCLHRNNI